MYTYYGIEIARMRHRDLLRAAQQERLGRIARAALRVGRPIQPLRPEPADVWAAALQRYAAAVDA